MRAEQRILAIDYGARRIGLAISDPLGIIASGIGTLENTNDLIERIKSIITERHVIRVVVGMPLSLNGLHGDAAKMVVEFIEKLKNEIDVPIETFDERFTSSIATQTIRNLGVGKKKRREKGKIDEIAAIILLQEYLQYLSRNEKIQPNDGAFSV